MVAIGDERLCPRKLEYGSKLDRKLPSMLYTLTTCRSDPLKKWSAQLWMIGLRLRRTSQTPERAHERSDCGACPWLP